VKSQRFGFTDDPRRRFVVWALWICALILLRAIVRWMAPQAWGPAFV
jgi:hypothetical protein